MSGSNQRRRWARLENGRVAENPIWLDLDIAECMHGDAAKHFVDCTDAGNVGQFWTYSDGKFNPPPGPTREQQFQIAMLALQQLTTQRKQAGVWFTPQGYTAPLQFASDGNAQTELTGAFQLATMGLWTADSSVFTLQGKPIMMSAEDVAKLARAVGSYVLACNNYAARLVGLLEGDPNTNILGGWPSNGDPNPPAAAPMVVDVANAVFTDNPNPPAQ